MNNANPFRRSFAASWALSGWLVLLAVVLPVRAEDAPPRQCPPNAFFAINFVRGTRYATPDAQAELLKALGYDGMGYMGSPQRLPAAFQATDAHGLKMYTAYLGPGGDISIDPDARRYDPRMKGLIRALKGRDTLLVICFRSRKYKRSSPEGDARAVSVAQELADYAQPFGVRVAIYPHVNHWSERVEDVVRIAKKADRENLGVCFNLYHWLRTDPQKRMRPLLELAMPHLFLVTINGSMPEGSYETLDRGSFDVYPLLETLKELDYTGPIGLQCVGVRGDDSREILQRSMDAWRELSARLATTCKCPGREEAAD